MVSRNSMNDAQSQLPPSTEPASRPDRGKFLWLWRWFWRVTLVVSLPYAWYCFYVPSNSIAWADNYTSAHLLFGSVAEYVMRHARCPVVTVRARPADEPPLSEPLVMAPKAPRFM